MEDHLTEGVEGYCRQASISKLKALFKESVHVTNMLGGDSTVIFRDTSSNIIHDKWYAEKHVDHEAEKKE